MHFEYVILMVVNAHKTAHMKKIVLTLSALFVLAGLQAQNSLSILTLETDVWGSVETSIMQSIGTIENTNGTAAIAVRAERITIDTVPGTQNYFCWEQCYEPPTSISPTTISLDPGQRMEQFYAD